MIGGLCPGGSLSGGISLQGDLCLGRGSLSRGLYQVDPPVSKAWVVRILLECILVFILFCFVLFCFELVHANAEFFVKFLAETLLFNWKYFKAQILQRTTCR